MVWRRVVWIKSIMAWWNSYASTGIGGTMGVYRMFYASNITN